MAAQQRTNIWIDGTQAGATLTELKKKVNLLNREIKDLPRNSDEYKKKAAELRQANQALSNHRNEIRGVGEAYGSAKTGLKGLLQQFSPFTGTLALVTAGIGGVVAGTMSWLKNNRDMEKSLSSLKAITGATAEDLEFYKNQSIEISKVSQTSAIDIVKGFELIGSARPELLKNKEALAAVTKEAVILSEAAGMDLADAAQSLAGTMNQFNVGAEHSRRIINALAAGSLEGASGITSITESIDAFGAVAASSNVTIEESIALVEVLGDKNIKGAEAGTKLRNVLLNVATASALPKEAIDAMQKYGVNLDIVQDKSIPLETRLRELAKVQGDQNALVKIFGKENVVAGQTILQNIDRFKDLTIAVTGSNTALDQQKAMNDNLDGAIKNLSKAWQTFTLSLNGSSGATKILKNAVQFLADNLESVIKTVSILVVSFATYKGILALARLQKVLFNAELRKQVFGMRQASTATDAAGKSVKNYGAAMKAIGWTVLIAFALEQAMAFLEIATGAADAKDAVDRYNKAIEYGKNFGQASVKIIEEKYQKEKQNLDLLASKTIANGGISEAEHKKRLAELDKEIDARIKGEIRLANENKELAKKTGRNDIVAKENQVLKELIALKKQRDNAEIDSEIQKNKTLTELSEEEKRKAIENQKKKNDSIKKLNDELNRVIAKAKELSEEEAFQKFLQSYDEGLAKEIVLLEKSIEDKYEKEIEAALKLMNEKGEIGIKAGEAFNSLMITMQEELERESLELAKKYNKQKQEADIANAKETHDTLLSKQEEFETALADLKVSEAQLAQSQILEGDLSGQRKAVENLQKAEIEKVEITKKFTLQRIEIQEKEEIAAQKKRYDEGLISKEDYESLVTSIQDSYSTQRQLIETNSQNEIVKINENTTSKIIELDQQKLDEISKNLQIISGITSQFSQLQLQNLDNELRREENNYKRGKKALEAKLNSGRISQDQYNTELEQLDKDYANKKLSLEKKQFEAKKQAQIIQIMIDTAAGAVAAMSAGPIAGPILAAAAIIFGGAQLAMASQQEFPEVDQFNEGGYSNVTGAKDGKRYRARNVGRLNGGMTPNSPSMVLVSETKPEYFVPGGLLESNPQVANYVGMIEAIRTNRVRQFNDGGYTVKSASFGGGSDFSAIIERNNQIMQLLYEEIRKGVRVDFNQRKIEDLEKEQNRLASIKS
jgi:TP901 family phage tail tape measure protein